MERGEELKILSDQRQNYIMSGDLDEFEQVFIEGLNISVQRILKLINELEESSYILQYKILVLYCLDKDISSYVLKEKFSYLVDYNKEIGDDGVIISAFSGTSNYDIKKDLFYKRRDIVNTVVSNKPKSYKEGISLERKLINKENENNYTINYKNIYDNKLDIIRRNRLL
jgi:hypothetical protein